MRNPIEMMHVSQPGIPRPRTAPTEQVESLLNRRAEMGADLMCRLCHGMPASMGGVLAVETTLVTRWPRRFAHASDGWSIEDAGFIHDPAFNPHPGCRYCHPVKVGLYIADGFGHGLAA